jgi:hypothetical protein
VYNVITNKWYQGSMEEGDASEKLVKSAARFFRAQMGEMEKKLQGPLLQAGCVAVRNRIVKIRRFSVAV